MKISNFFLILFFFLYSGNLSAEIFYIDIDKIINQTNVGKHINTEFKNSKKLHNKKNLEYFRKYILNDDVLDKQFDSLTSSIITPDKDIIPDAENLSPAYIVFDNYEIILQWNRSLRFSLAVCTLKEKFENAL